MVNIWLICGEVKRILQLKIVDGQINIHTLDEHVRNLFPSILREPYDLKVYDAKGSRFINLDQKELDSEFNPLRVKSYSSDQQFENSFIFVDVYVDKSSSGGLGLILGEDNNTVNLSPNVQEHQQGLIFI